jgi:cyclophilin family peptidyl-prolyl cis-trans isomerase
MSAPLVAIVSFVFASAALAPSFAKASTFAKATADKTEGKQSPAKTSPGAGAVVVVETEKGTFEFETYPNEAPKTVAHILGLINKRFYNGQRVHRVVPGFVVQMGDQQTRDMTKEEMWGRAVGPQIGAAEFSKLRTHVRGAVAMAHNGDAAKADTQFYITLAAAHRLDGDYVVFGKVISGMDVVTKLQYTDRIVRVTVRGAK